VKTFQQQKTIQFIVSHRMKEYDDDHSIEGRMMHQDYSFVSINN